MHWFSIKRLRIHGCSWFTDWCVSRDTFFLRGVNIQWLHTSNATMLKIIIFKCKWQKKLKKIVDVHKICVYNPKNIRNQIWNALRGIKDKQNIYSVTKKQNITIHMAVYLFYFSKCILNLVLKNLGIVKKNIVNPYKFISTFLSLTI
jgi:hypothetical protein